MTSVPVQLPVQTARPALSIGADWGVVALLAFWVFVVRGSWIGDPVADIDEQLYSFIGERMLHGDLPFVDWWDRKPFGLFAIFAFAHAIGGPGPAAYQMLAAVATLAGAVTTYALARPLCDRAGSAVAGALYVNLMSLYAAYSGQSENFHVPLMLTMVLLLRNQYHPEAGRRAMVAMAIGGVALQIKYTVLPQCIFFGLWALAGQYRREPNFRALLVKGAMFAALGILPTALIALFYAALGHFEAFVYANFISFFERGTLPEGRIPKELHLWALPAGAMLFGGLYSAWRIRPPRDPQLYAFYCAWFAATLATVFLPSSLYQYYLAALAPTLSLLATPLFDRRSLNGWFPGLALVAFTIYLLDLPQRQQESARQRHDFEAFAALIAPHVGQTSDCLLVFDGPTALYRMTGSCAHGPLIYPDHLNNRLERNATGISQIDTVRSRLAQRPPVIVSVDRALTPQTPEVAALMRETLARDYRPIATANLHQRIQIAYLRRDLEE